MKILTCLITIASLACAAHAAERKRILLVTTTLGFRHAAVPVQEQMIRESTMNQAVLQID